MMNNLPFQHVADECKEATELNTGIERSIHLGLSGAWTN